MIFLRYGLLYYRPTGNIGDEIQSLAARQFLPRVDVLVDREGMRDFRSPEQVRMILNGWYMCVPAQWPPAAAISPLLASMHVVDKRPVTAAWFSRDNRRYLLEHGPVGARDTATLAVLERHGVPAYFSGCLTLSLQRNGQAVHEDYVCAVDVDRRTLAELRARTARPVMPVTHWLPRHMKPKDTIVFAEMLLDLYQRAHCVVTTRLHAALPCLALETPVLLLHTAEDSRFAGLDALARHCTCEDYVNGKFIFDLDSPGENPPDYLVLRERLIESCCRFIGPEGEQAYAVNQVRLFEGLLPSIAAWEEQKRFGKAVVDMHRGHFRPLLAEIGDLLARHRQSRRRL